MNKIKKYKKILLLYNWILTTQFGIDLRLLFNGILRLPSFILSYFKISKLYRGKITIQPCLHDKYDNSGSATTEYFIQDLLVSQLVYKNNPKNHYDIGSRIDGFVAQVASFRKIDVFDIRPLNSNIKNVTFRQLDIMNNINTEFNNSTDSLSCLHTIEHFGLGRYGDIIDINGYVNGVTNLSKILENQGILYLSTPIGKEKIFYNANWVFNPYKLIDLFSKNNLNLIDFYYIKDGITKNISLLTEEHLNEIIYNEYGLGIFILKKEL